MKSAEADSMNPDNAGTFVVKYRNATHPHGAGDWRPGSLHFDEHYSGQTLLEILDISKKALKRNPLRIEVEKVQLPYKTTGGKNTTLVYGKSTLWLQFDTPEMMKRFFAILTQWLKPGTEGNGKKANDNAPPPQPAVRRSPRIMRNDPNATSQVQEEKQSKAVLNGHEENGNKDDTADIGVPNSESAAMPDDFLFGVVHDENSNAAIAKNRQNGRIQTSTPMRHTARMSINNAKPKIERPRDKENQHRTPVKSTSSQSEISQKRTPLSDKRCESGSDVSSIDNLTYTRNQRTPIASAKIPGLLNMPTRDIYKEGSSSKRTFNDQSSSVDSKTKKLKVNDIENDVGWKQGPSSAAASTEKMQLKGFSNIGNTCYMNSILQALFALDPFAKELIKCHNFFDKRIPVDWLLSSLPMLLGHKDCDSQSLKVELLTMVKSAISTSATRFMGNEQHDAHEFLAQVLDQLKEEISKLTGQLTPAEVPPLNPVQCTFEFGVCHYIECQACHDILRKEEQFNDLSLVLPYTTREEDDRPLSLQYLLNDFFKDEAVSYKCEKCGGESATMTHKFTKLPRILILHLKRYVFQDAISGNVKVATTIAFPRFLSLHRLCAEALVPTPPLSESTKKIPIPRSLPDFSSASQSNGNGISSVEKAKRQLAFGQPDEKGTESSVSEKKYCFRRNGYNTRSTSALGSMYALDADESDPINEVLERSKLETGPSADWEDGDAEFRRQMDEAIRKSMIETSGLSDTTEQCEPCADATVTAEGTENQSCGDMDPEMVLNAEDGHLQPSFRLCGVVNHIGSRTASGHYISDVFDITTSTWRSYDDSHVTETNETEVRKNRQKTAYIFFYIAGSLVDDSKAGSSSWSR